MGISRSEQHCSWLTNILNKAAVECISRSGSPLCQQDLASCINVHFMEVIEELHQQDAAGIDDAGGDGSSDNGDQSSLAADLGTNLMVKHGRLI